MATIDISFEELLWAFGIVSSRSFRTPLTTDHDVSLLPIVDLVNHEPSWPHLAFEERDDKSWTYTTLTRDVKARSEVFLRL